MSRTQLIIIYQNLCPEHQGHFAMAGWDRDQLITAVREREDSQVPGTRPAPLISGDIPADSAACQQLVGAMSDMSAPRAAVVGNRKLNQGAVLPAIEP